MSRRIDCSSYFSAKGATSRQNTMPDIVITRQSTASNDADNPTGSACPRKGSIGFKKTHVVPTSILPLLCPFVNLRPQPPGTKGNATTWPDSETIRNPDSPEHPAFRIGPGNLRAKIQALPCHLRAGNSLIRSSPGRDRHFRWNLFEFKGIGQGMCGDMYPCIDKIILDMAANLCLSVVVVSP